MATQTKDDKSRKAALVDLFHESENKAMKALEKLKDVGDATVIEPLVQLHMRTEVELIQAKVEEILSSLKNKSVVEPIVEMLQDEQYQERRALLLAALWNSGLFPGEHIHVFTQVAIEGDYLTAVEAITVIENVEPPFDETAVEEADYLLQNHLDQGIEEDKRDLLLSLHEIIESYRGQLGF